MVAPWAVSDRYAVFGGPASWPDYRQYQRTALYQERSEKALRASSLNWGTARALTISNIFPWVDSGFTGACGSAEAPEIGLELRGSQSRIGERRAMAFEKPQQVGRWSQNLRLRQHAGQRLTNTNTEALHPVVRIHPVTRRRCLFVNENDT